MNDKKPWADEPTPQTDRNLRANGEYVQGAPGKLEKFMPPDFARDLERRLRHALKLVNSLRIDVMHDTEFSDIGTMDLDGRLGDIEEVLQ